MSNNNNTRTVSANITASVSAEGILTIQLPLLAEARVTKNGKSIIVAESGTWPQSWATVNVDGALVGLNITALIDNPEYVAPVTTPVAKYFNKKANGNGNGNNKNGLAAIRKLARTMPGTV